MEKPFAITTCSVSTGLQGVLGNDGICGTSSPEEGTGKCLRDVSRYLWTFHAGNRLGSIEAQEGEVRLDCDHPCAKVAGSG